MKQSVSYSKAFQLVASCSVIVLLTACGGGTNGDDGTTNSIALGSASSNVLADASGNSVFVEQASPVADEPQRDSVDFVPTFAGQLDIAYADDASGTGQSDDLIVTQWANMQTCLQVSALEPTVTVVSDRVVAESPTDDTIRHIDGQILASSHVTDSSAAIQIHSSDFDGSVGNPGFNLRSIMGRYLWLANGLDERDYPYECAANG